MRIALIILILAGMSVATATEIHRCALADGTFAYQEMPCPIPPVDADDGAENTEGHEDSEASAINDDVDDFVNPFDADVSPPARSEATLSEPVSPDRADCQKTARDAIDAIDLKMRESAYTKEQGQAYLADLLVLTQQLRDCKQR
jgi:hypothetical protein